MLALRGDTSDRGYRNTYDGSLSILDTGQHERFYLLRSEVYPFTDVPQTVRGPFWVEQVRALAALRERYDRGGSGNLDSGDKWIADVTAAMLAASRRQDEQATP